MLDDNGLLDGDGLLARWDYRDTDGTGKLEVAARYQGFAGRSAAWFGDGDLRSFANGLAATYPLGEREFSVSGGYSSPDEEHVALSVRARGRRGQLGVTVHLAVPSDHRSDVEWSSSDVRLEILTTYEALGRFASELRHLVDGNVDEARLDAERLG